MCKKASGIAMGVISADELQTAEQIWIRNTQQFAFQEEILNLKKTTPSVKRLPLVRQLRLFLDSADLLRCEGRINNAPLSESARFPYLLPAKHPLTELIIIAAHQGVLHSGVNSTVTHIRQKYWIPCIRQCVRKLLRRCVRCRKVEGNSYSRPDPAPLPRSRTMDAPPFTVTGVDFTGALYVKGPRGQELKVYLCLFTCASTRAVHLEVVSDLSVESFLMAFRRFTTRKSLPRKMISDNASTYLAAAKELTHLFQSSSLKAGLSDYGVEWQFIPKRAPWYGGFWERLIRLTKNALKKTLGRAKVTLTMLETIVTEVEAVLNDRPLTYVSSDINNAEPLTPAHLLYGRRITTLPHAGDFPQENEVSNTGDCATSCRGKLQMLIIGHFRQRWKREYLTSLREFHRASGNNKQFIKIGDVIQIHGDGPRLCWNLGVIDSLIEGRDGLIRAANVRTKFGLTSRPISKLYPLEVPDL